VPPGSPPNRRARGDADQTLLEAIRRANRHRVLGLDLHHLVDDFMLRFSE